MSKPSATIPGQLPLPGITRKAFNTIVPNRVYQRGQVLTWPREDKAHLIQNLNIQVVVNFWPKLDSDWGELPVWYWHLPSNRAIGMLDPKMVHVADLLSNFLAAHNASALILCEAGKTRSVFFCTLLIKNLLQISYPDALKQMNAILPGHRMKDFMVEWLGKNQTVRIRK